MIQVLTLNGRIMPAKVLEHLLLAIGLAGAYGGQTSIYGINVKNHIAGIFGAAFERPIASPYEAVKTVTASTADEALHQLAAAFRAEYAAEIAAAAVADLQRDLIAKVEANDSGLRQRYRETHHKVGDFFDAWFGLGAAAKKKAKKS